MGRVTKGFLSGNPGETPHEDFKVNGEYVNTPTQGLVGIPFLDEYITLAGALRAHPVLAVSGMGCGFCGSSRSRMAFNAWI